jgi:ribonucleoside-diphosphate reductase alpha chain
MTINTIKTIQKRNGTSVPYNEAKINLVIDYGCEGLEVDSNKLKEKVKFFIHDGISTEHVQKILINNALSFVSIEEPAWKFVASRLLSLDMYKVAKRTQNYDLFGYGDYVAFVKKAVEDRLYDKVILEKYSEEELKEVALELNPKYDLDFDYGGMMSMHDRYLIRNNEGKIFELPQQMYLTCALFVCMNEHKANRLKWVKKVYHACGARYLSLATPILMNLRKRNGNLASCFITKMWDDLESIYGVLDQAAQISKNGGGVGVNISHLRSHGAYIKNRKGASGGVFGWVKLLNDTAVAVNQIGVRSGAITIALDVWHRDILEFLEIQAENGDQRNKAYDIFPQIVVNKTFLEIYNSGGDWYLFDPHEIRSKYSIELADLWGIEFKKTYFQLCRLADEGKIELVTKIKAADIVRKALMSAMETGMPYWFNKDTVNLVNPNKHVGMIGSANLCVESFSNFSATKPGSIIIEELEDGTYVSKRSAKLGYTHVCNLISQNSSKIYENSDIEKYARLSVRILDNLLDIGSPPIPEANIHNDDYRILGVGNLGFHDHLIHKGLRYSDPAAVKYTGEYFEKIAYFCIDESANLARDRGRYKFFEGSDWQKGIFFGRSGEELRNSSKTELNWDVLVAKVKENGMRNGGLLAIAPNTGTGGLLGASASILPIFDLMFSEKNSLGSSPVVAQFLSAETIWLYESFKNIDQKCIIDMTATIQKWTDQGISMELMLNLDKIKGAAELRNLYIYAMDKDIKTIYYLRSKTKKSKKVAGITNISEQAQQQLEEESSCVVCAN